MSPPDLNRGNTVVARRTGARALVAAVVLSVVAVSPLHVANGATESDSSDPATDSGTAAATIPADVAALVPGLDARLADAPISSGPASAAIATLREADEALDVLLVESADLQESERRLQEALDKLTATERRAADELAVAEGRKRRLAAAAYTQDPSSTQGYAILDASGPVEVARRGRLAGSVGETLNTAAHVADDLRAAASDGAATVGDELAGVRNRRADLDASVQEAVAAIVAARDEVTETLPRATVAGLDIPLVALDAYLRAERLAAFTDPECGVTWWHLAGIGRTESDHGRFKDSEPDEDGNVSPPILGVPLNGKGVAAIGDSDGGELDFDVVHDRAVGPMQFIPSTWERWGSDGNADDDEDPQNLYDAAYSAARYLCAVAGGSLTDDSQLNRAFLGYNHSLSYVATVRERGEEYRDDADFLPPLDLT